MAESPKMLMEKEGPLGWIIFNQPEKRNAVSQEMWQMVPEMVKDLEEDEDIRVIILRGAGDQAFVAGADISQFWGTIENSVIARVYLSLLLLTLAPTRHSSKHRTLLTQSKIPSKCDRQAPSL
jgi:enoyl-CoA hydratase/carnithine racemase